MIVLFGYVLEGMFPMKNTRWPVSDFLQLSYAHER